VDTQLNLELILIIGSLFFGLVLLFYFFIGRKKRLQSNAEDPILLDYAKLFFPILFLVLIVRSFVAEPFRIPSGSMIPTLEIGDFIVVKKYAYGLRLPVLNKKILNTGQPQRGDVVVFRYPPEPEINYIKRLVGLPGDKIEWTYDKKLIINGNAVKYRSNKDYPIKNRAGKLISVTHLNETLPDSGADGVAHNLILFNSPTRAGEWIVPDGHYFMMGDNRDKSSDSRFWGFVPEANLVGKASMVWMHWNWLDGGDGFQVGRIGASVD